MNANIKYKHRQIYNRKILEVLAKVIEDFPDWRFQQILQNLNIVIPGSDAWYQESFDTFKQLPKNIFKSLNK